MNPRVPNTSCCGSSRWVGLPRLSACCPLSWRKPRLSRPAPLG
ncbi:hypothetical protein EVA_14067 [gut metagenome]|uniref:Uncharacterized protein n=1 Tax=gut metagenome TaxID=749906 RepID=J9FTJ7_9ZZZZ